MKMNTGASRRAVVRGLAGTVGAAALAPITAMAQQPTAATGAPPTVISNPSLDSDELKFFQRFLPVVDKTGNNP